MEPAWVLWYLIVTIDPHGHEALEPAKQPMPSFEVCAATALKLFGMEIPDRLEFRNVMCVDENALEIN